MRRGLRRLLQIVLVLALAVAGAMAWGFWYSRGHADVQFHVLDAAQPAQPAPPASQGVELLLRDGAGRELARVRTVASQGYLLAVHPDPDIGNCQPPAGAPARTLPQAEFARCYERYSRWTAGWARDVDHAEVTAGTCRLERVPVRVHHFDDEWLTWWIPVPHGGGLPRQYFTFTIAIDSRVCR